MSHKLDNAIPSWLEAAIDLTYAATSAQPSSSESEPLITTPPSYNDAMAMTTSTCSSGMSMSMPSSSIPPSNKLSQLFFHLDAHGFVGSKSISSLGLPPLTKAAGPVVCLYYNLIGQATAYTIPKALKKIPFCSKTPAMVRLVIDSVANYAFMLAVIHAGSTRAGQLRYSDMLLYNCDHSVSETRMYVRGEIVRRLMEGLGVELHRSAGATGGSVSYYRGQEAEEEEEQDQDQDQVDERLAQRHNDLKSFINDLLDSLEKNVYSKHTMYTYPDKSNLLADGDGELDGYQLQECWRLFKTVLHNHAQTGGTAGNGASGGSGGVMDLLPPVGYCSRYQGTKQECLRPLFFTRKMCEEMDGPCLLERAFGFLCCGAQCH